MLDIISIPLCFYAYILCEGIYPILTQCWKKWQKKAIGVGHQSRIKGYCQGSNDVQKRWREKRESGHQTWLASEFEAGVALPWQRIYVSQICFLRKTRFYLTKRSTDSLRGHIRQSKDPFRFSQDSSWSSQKKISPFP